MVMGLGKERPRLLCSKGDQARNLKMKQELIEFFQNVDNFPGKVIVDIVLEMRMENKLQGLRDADLCNWGLSYRMNNWFLQRTPEEQAQICWTEEWR